jgi:hypothetical protein
METLERPFDVGHGDKIPTPINMYIIRPPQTSSHVLPSNPQPYQNYGGASLQCVSHDPGPIPGSIESSLSTDHGCFSHLLRPDMKD